MKEVLNELKTFNEGNDRGKLAATRSLNLRIDTILTRSWPSAELEGIFNLITSLIVSNNSDEEATPLLSHVCSILTEEASAGASVDRSLVRYRMLVLLNPVLIGRIVELLFLLDSLSNIFNSLPSSSSNRYNVFVSLLELANKNDELEVIADAISSIPCWLSEWNISAQEKAALLESVATKLQEAEQGAKAYDFLLTHLRYISTSTISGKDASSAETKAAAEKTIAAALNLVNVFDFEELSQVEAVKQLQDEPVGKLLTICISGTSKDWRSWKDANKSEMERLGLSSELLERKIKLLDLASLCSQSISSEVPYTEIAKTLEIESDQVEIWVIDVIRAGLVSGKLSQINQSLRVYKSVYRSFDLDQWKLLEKRLSTWESSITNILSTIAGKCCYLSTCCLSFRC